MSLTPEFVQRVKHFVEETYRATGLHPNLFDIPEAHRDWVGVTLPCLVIDTWAEKYHDTDDSVDWQITLAAMETTIPDPIGAEIVASVTDTYRVDGSMLDTVLVGPAPEFTAESDAPTHATIVERVATLPLMEVRGHAAAQVLLAMEAMARADETDAAGE